jgi:hypothetical protein
MVNRLLFYAAPTELGLNLSAEDYKQVAPNAAFDLPSARHLQQSQAIS